MYPCCTKKPAPIRVIQKLPNFTQFWPPTASSRQLWTYMFLLTSDHLPTSFCPTGSYWMPLSLFSLIHKTYRTSYMLAPGLIYQLLYVTHDALVLFYYLTPRTVMSRWDSSATTYAVKKLSKFFLSCQGRVPAVTITAAD